MLKNLIVIFVLLFISNINMYALNTEKPNNQVNNLALANPASVYCAKIGGVSSTKQNKKGTYAICNLPNGEKIEEWDLYYRDHPRKII